jgi:flagellar biosynthesis protein FlhG
MKRPRSIEKDLLPIRNKSIAVASGKGGVGKTTTAVNLAIHYARKGLSVALVDLDPLSDVATLLDIEESERQLSGAVIDGADSIRSLKNEIFDKLDLIFPRSKLRELDREKIKALLYGDFVEELTHNYDILIFDMPAGIRYEDNLFFIPYMKQLLIVTASEPTAHVSAGGYIKNVLEAKSNVRLGLWHNRHLIKIGPDFNPRDVVGNYNRNVSKQERISPRLSKTIKDLAFIPHDPSLDLLRGNPSLLINIERSMVDVLEMIQAERIASLLQEYGFSARSLELMRFYIVRNRDLRRIDVYLGELESYLANFLDRRGQRPGTAVFTRQQRTSLRSVLQSIKDDRLRVFVVALIGLLEKSIAKREESKSPFYVGERFTANRAVDRKLSRLLIYMNHTVRRKDSFLQNVSGVLVFYFSLYKLFQSETVGRLIADFIPKRRNSRGDLVRDKFLQIRNLVENNREYRLKYIGLIKTLFPILCRQILVTIETFELSRLLFKNDDDTLSREAYLKLFNNFMHEAVNSGLGVVVGFNYRPASIAFQKAANRLLREMNTS